MGVSDRVPLTSEDLGRRQLPSPCDHMAPQPRSQRVPGHETCGEIEHQTLLIVDGRFDDEPVQFEKTAIAAGAIRLLPSMNGWFSARPNANALAFSTTDG